MMRFGSLFAGIGGFDLGFERAGMTCAWQVEIDPFCLKVLETRFPHAKRYGDIRDIDADRLEPVDVICGGFPCQDISVANANGKGLDGERSGLWFEFARIVRAVKPRWVVVENVARLLSINAGRDFGIILRDLAASGYDVEWDVLPAAAFGAPHIRERVFLVAYTNGTNGAPRFPEAEQAGKRGRRFGSSRSTPRVFAYASQQGLEGDEPAGALCADGLPAKLRRWWAVEPELGRMAHGIPDRVDRLSGLGNAVVPQIAEWLAWRIIALEQAA